MEYGSSRAMTDSIPYGIKVLTIFYSRIRGQMKDGFEKVDGKQLSR